jgi:putative transposase
MEAYSTPYNISAKWGFENRTYYSEIKNDAAAYRTVRSVVPELPSSLVQGAKDVACEALKHTQFKFLPIKKEYSAIRYNQRVYTVRFESMYISLSTVKAELKLRSPFDIL